MASKQTFECFVCKRNGFPETRVYLDGKTEDGKTIYKNEDMSSHQHKRQQQQGQGQIQQSQQQMLAVGAVADLMLQVKAISARLEYAISLLEKLTKAEE